MKISILNSHDNVGGAAKAAFRLYNGLRQRGIEANFLVRESELNDHTSFEIKRSKSDVYIEKAVQQFCVNKNRTDVSNTFFSFNYGKLGKQLIERCKNSDIINLHWIDHFVSNQDLQAIAELNKPIVWTLHDQKPFTGGCHYSAGCEKYRESCIDCHMLNDTVFSLPERVLKHKIDIFKGANLTVVSPSKWLADEAKKSALFSGSRIEVIPNAVDTNVFLQQDKRKSKISLGINPDAIVLQFGAQNGNATRKGFSYLLKAIKLALLNHEFRSKCDNGEVVILCLGQPDKNVAELPVENVVLGYISNEKEISVAYSATDVFILPSLEDNLPNTILEAMACGTHVVGFDTGGFSDVVNELNGSVIEKGDSEQLSRAIVEAVLNDDMRIRKNSLCRSIIESSYTFAHQADLYQDLFKSLLASHQGGDNELNANAEHNYFDIVGYALLQDNIVNKMYSTKKRLENSSKKHTDVLEEKTRVLQQKLDEAESQLKQCTSTTWWRFLNTCKNIKKRYLS